MYGFVYLWRDKGKNRWYIGSHWGTEDDGYICSSNWMNISYKRRPQDFRRRILSRVYTTKEDLLEEEYRILQKIRKEELGIDEWNKARLIGKGVTASNLFCFSYLVQ